MVTAYEKQLLKRIDVFKVLIQQLKEDRNSRLAALNMLDKVGLCERRGVLLGPLSELVGLESEIEQLVCSSVSDSDAVVRLSSIKALRLFLGSPEAFHLLIQTLAEKDPMTLDLALSGIGQHWSEIGDYNFIQRQEWQNLRRDAIKKVGLIISAFLEDEKGGLYDVVEGAFVVSELKDVGSWKQQIELIHCTMGQDIMVRIKSIVALAKLCPEMIHRDYIGYRKTIRLLQQLFQYDDSRAIRGIAGALIPGGPHKSWFSKIFHIPASLSPEKAIMHYKRGDALDSASNYDEAYVEFSKALKLLPTEPSYWCARGYTQCNAGRVDEGLTDLYMAVHIAPYMASTHADLGYGHFLEGDYSMAKTWLNKAIYLNPNYPFAHFWRGHSYKAIGAMDAASQDFRWIVQYSSDEEMIEEAEEELI